MANRLTKKEQTFVNKYLETGHGVQSALAAYDTEDYNTAGAIASENLRKPKIIDAIQKALSDDLLSKVHLEGLFATKPVIVKTETGIEVIDETADFQVRAKYLDMAYKIKGSYAPEKRVTLNIESEPSERIKKLAEKLNQ